MFQVGSVDCCCVNRENRDVTPCLTSGAWCGLFCNTFFTCSQGKGFLSDKPEVICVVARLATVSGLLIASFLMPSFVFGDV